MLLADLLPQILPNPQAVMLVHHLGSRNKFLMNNALKVENNANMYVSDLTCLTFFGRGEVFPPTGSPFCFWVLTVNPDFVSCS